MIKLIYFLYIFIFFIFSLRIFRDYGVVWTKIQRSVDTLNVQYQFLYIYIFKYNIFWFKQCRFNVFDQSINYEINKYNARIVLQSIARMST